MKNILKGVDASPALVGAARGVVEAAVLAALGAAVYYLNGDNLPANLVPFVPVLLLVIRVAEGYADHRIDPTQNRATVAVEAAQPQPAPQPAPVAPAEPAAPNPPAPQP